MKKTVIALMFITGIGFGLPGFAAEPSLHEVYQAADAGRMDDAQRMMKEVLQAHPGSAKAHYVEAELLAKQGQTKAAESELATAEKLAPGLPFASAQSVSSLRGTIEHRAPTAVAQPQPVQMAPVQRESGLPWGMIFMGLGLIAFIVWASRLMANRNAQYNAGGAQPGMAGGYRPPYSPAPYGGSPQGYGMPGQMPASGPGLGSQVLGGLATGAAVGAGVVAGEAMMHHFMDGDRPSHRNDQSFADSGSIPNLPSTPLDDMGGSDFGIADNSSWDDSSGGGSDWT